MKFIAENVDMYEMMQDVKKRREHSDLHIGIWSQAQDKKLAREIEEEAKSGWSQLVSEASREPRRVRGRDP